MGKQKKTKILKLEKDDPEREEKFEEDFLQSLTPEERYKLFFKMNNLLKKILLDNGHRKTSEIIKRK